MPSGLEKRAPELRTLSLAGAREDCTDAVPLGCFHGAVNAVRASVLDALLNFPVVISDPASLHTFPFRFSDPDTLGQVVCSGFFFIGWFYIGFRAFPPFPWPYFSMTSPQISGTP